MLNMFWLALVVTKIIVLVPGWMMYPVFFDGPCRKQTGPKKHIVMHLGGFKENF